MVMDLNDDKRKSNLSRDGSVLNLGNCRLCVWLVEADEFSRFRKASLNRSTVLSSFLTN